MNPRARSCNILLLVVISACVGFLGCGPEPTSQQSTLPTTRMVLAEKPFTLEIANTEASRERGLMYRDSIPADHGMIFVFPDTRARAFWMRNTRIPLDIIYINPDATIVSTHTMKPFDISSTPSAGPAMYAIELDAGTVAQLNLKPGDKLEIPPEARKTDR